MHDLEKQYKSLQNLGFHEFRNLVFRISPDSRFTYSLKHVLQTSLDRLMKKKEEFPLPEGYDFISSMPSIHQQIRWTGNYGGVLAKYTADFMQLLFFHAQRLGIEQDNLAILDYGCGWGRMLRMLPYFAEVSNIYGVDPTPESITLCQQHNVPGTYGLIDHLPKELPWKQKFDLIYAYSVFTHMNDESALNAVQLIRKNISPHGLLCITIRPRDYWKANVSGGKLGKSRQENLLKQYDDNGYAFLPYSENKHGGPSNWGDTAFSLNYIEEYWNDWKIVMTDTADSQPFQNLVFLKPV